MASWQWSPDGLVSLSRKNQQSVPKGRPPANTLAADEADEEQKRILAGRRRRRRNDDESSRCKFRVPRGSSEFWLCVSSFSRESYR